MCIDKARQPNAARMSDRQRARLRGGLDTDKATRVVNLHDTIAQNAKTALIFNGLKDATANTFQTLGKSHSAPSSAKRIEINTTVDGALSQRQSLVSIGRIPIELG